MIATPQGLLLLCSDMKIGAWAGFFIKPEMLRYVLVAGFITVFDLAAFWLLEKLLPPSASFVLAYAFAVLVRFVLDKWWTFRCPNPEVGRQLARYVVVSLISCAVGWAFFKYFLLLWRNGMLANVLSIPPTTLLTFFLFRTRVFHSNQRPHS